jgi:hypothetical protein
MKTYLRKPDVWVVWPQAPRSETVVYMVQRDWLKNYDETFFGRPLVWLILLFISLVVPKGELDVLFHEVSDEAR